MKTRVSMIICVTAALLMLRATDGAAQVSWSTSHASGSNTSFLGVATAPAGRGSLPIPNLGVFATGVAAVNAPDGTVYIANTSGKLFAFRADGTPAWSREITYGQVVNASPAVTSDGSIFVVASTVVNDQRGGANFKRRDLFLHKFTVGGGWNGPVRFPLQSATQLEQYQGSGFSTAPLNVWRFGSAEALMVPVLYPLPGGAQLRVLAFSTDGGFLGDVIVKQFRDEIAGDPGELLGSRFRLGTLPGLNVLPPMPGVSIFSQSGATPVITVSDINHEVVGFTFELTGSRGRFTERFRFPDSKGGLASAPAHRPDGHPVAATTNGRLLFPGPSRDTRPAVTGLAPVFSTPTVLPDGRLLVVDYAAPEASLVVIRGSQVLSRTRLPSAVFSAAASNSHIYVATDSSLLTFDTATMQQVQKFDWIGGGYWPPSIGPQGHVYAIVKNILLVFPPPSATTQPRMPPPPPGTSGGTVRDHRAPAPRDHR